MQGVRLSSCGVQVLFELMDANGSGSVELEDFEVLMHTKELRRPVLETLALHMPVGGGVAPTASPATADTLHTLLARPPKPKERRRMQKLLADRSLVVARERRERAAALARQSSWKAGPACGGPDAVLLLPSVGGGGGGGSGGRAGTARVGRNRSGSGVNRATWGPRADRLVHKVVKEVDEEEEEEEDTGDDASTHDDGDDSSQGRASEHQRRLEPSSDADDADSTSTGLDAHSREEEEGEGVENEDTEYVSDEWDPLSSTEQPWSASSDLPQQTLQRLLSRLTASMYTSKGRDPGVGFRRLDADRDGVLNWDEFQRVMRKQVGHNKCTMTVDHPAAHLGPTQSESRGGGGGVAAGAGC